ncbi:MAG TPA: gliding motility-associated C-terminal domain-containing protein, partial [Adhaeribacter sp.]|nr:gliding motility-associated C-terminal domain-containing protein [Adhaeribacter sp.]
IDMTLDNGLGDVTNVKNAFLNDSTFFASVAVKHRNNQDYWIIYQKQASSIFHTYLISPSGLNTSPVISNVSSLPSSASGWLLKASPDGQTLAFSGNAGVGLSDSIRLLAFDFSTGMVSKGIALYTPKIPSAMEFSPDGSKLYVVRQDTQAIGPNYSVLYQYDLDAGSPLAIQNSGTEIYKYNSGGSGFMQVAPDGKIYQTMVIANPATYLHAIQRPNLKGKACRFAINVIDLNPGNTTFRSVGDVLPSFVQSYFYRPKIVMQQTCFGDTARFELGNRAYVDSVEWNFGDPASGSFNTSKLFTPKHFYAAGGSYNVQAIVHFNYASDTVNQTIHIPTTIVKPDFGPDTAICQGDTLRLNAYQFGATYEWQDSLTTDSVFYVTSPGNYWVQVSNGCGVRYDTINVAFDKPLSLNLGADTLLCPGQQLVLNVNANGARILWQDSSTTSTFTVTKPGTYWAELRNACGSWRDSVTVTYRPLAPNNWLPKDTIICNNQSFLIKGYLPQALSYRWQNGSTDPSFTATTTGTYWLEVVTPCTTVRDSIKVAFAWPTTRFTDTTICTGDSFVLRAPEGLSYQWGTGETTRQITISKGGTYSVQMVTLPGCGFFDSIQVKEERCFKEPFIANIITPNNDQLNDRFEPKGLEAGSWELSIFNRWGKLIYKNENYKDQWPETSISDGTYYYLLRNRQTGKTYKGWVEVTR